MRVMRFRIADVRTPVASELVTHASPPNASARRGLYHSRPFAAYRRRRSSRSRGRSSWPGDLARLVPRPHVGSPRPPETDCEGRKEIERAAAGSRAGTRAHCDERNTPARLPRSKTHRRPDPSSAPPRRQRPAGRRRSASPPRSPLQRFQLLPAVLERGDHEGPGLPLHHAVGRPRLVQTPRSGSVRPGPTRLLLAVSGRDPDARRTSPSTTRRSPGRCHSPPQAGRRSTAARSGPTGCSRDEGLTGLSWDLDLLLRPSSSDIERRPADTWDWRADLWVGRPPPFEHFVPTRRVLARRSLRLGADRHGAVRPFAAAQRAPVRSTMSLHFGFDWQQAEETSPDRRRKDCGAARRGAGSGD
jgi:hypothetical protein